MCGVWPPRLEVTMSPEPVPFVARNRDRRPAVADAICREFHRSPRLALTLAQAARLWALDVSACRDVLDALVSDGVLSVRSDGRYVVDAGTTLRLVAS